MVSTGWKIPGTVQQDNRYGIVNHGTCYAYLDLDDIKKDTLNYAYIPFSGGIDSEHASPVIYAGNYNFNIPTNATINKIKIKVVLRQWAGKNLGGKSYSKWKTLKLKTGPSTTDYGVGTNRAPNENIKYETNKNSWTTREIGTQSGEECTPLWWGVEKITPSQINSSNFGCVFQVTGTGYKKWVDSQVAKILMNIEYTLPSPTKQEETTTFDIKINLNQEDTNKLDIAKPDDPITLNIEYIKKTGKTGQTPLLIVSSDELLIGESKLKSFTLPTLNVNSNTNSVTQELKIYPGTLTGIHKLDLKNNNTYDIITVNDGDKPPINLRVINSNTSTYTTITNAEKAKYENEAQRCVIKNSTFKNNVSNNKGGAMFILTENYYPLSNTFEGNTANSCPNTSWNGECSN